MMADSGSHQLHAEVSELVEILVKNILLYLAPQQQKRQKERIFSSIQLAYRSLTNMWKTDETDDTSGNPEMTVNVSSGSSVIVFSCFVYYIHID